ncbi:hypothetical protein SKAU_G00296640 [Synaphobranchus kaupii]|uniref:Uncharacterized protein n=1 Tax=Synaphobranchus kaupii TaxID=118154 RepID=A0A9Q1EUU7_SYNKA|nr:hypothetical protein SKAU_G00296640 [Synaphobranchus kaupii]
MISRVCRSLLKGFRPEKGHLCHRIKARLTGSVESLRFSSQRERRSGGEGKSHHDVTETAASRPACGFFLTAQRDIDRFDLIYTKTCSRGRRGVFNFSLMNPLTQRSNPKTKNLLITNTQVGQEATKTLKTEPFRFGTLEQPERPWRAEADLRRPCKNSLAARDFAPHCRTPAASWHAALEDEEDVRRVIGAETTPAGISAMCQVLRAPFG